jgi:Ca2+-binding EF-hand superfamily protein
MISVGELYNALKSETGVSFASSSPSRRVNKVDEFEKQVQQVADWIMTNYDVNRDKRLDNVEAEMLWRDVQSYDYAGINVIDVKQTKAWIAKFDTNKDGMISVGELVNAIKAEGPVSFQETYAVPAAEAPAADAPAAKAPAAEAPAATPVYTHSSYNYTNATNSTRQVRNHTEVKRESAEEKKLKQYAKWVLDNYDTNKDGQLDESEANKLWNDIATYDYSGELLAQVGQIQTWIAKFDTNKNGKLTIGELYNALSKFV